MAWHGSPRLDSANVSLNSNNGILNNSLNIERLITTPQWINCSGLSVFLNYQILECKTETLKQPFIFVPTMFITHYLVFQSSGSV